MKLEERMNLALRRRTSNVILKGDVSRNVRGNPPVKSSATAIDGPTSGSRLRIPKVGLKRYVLGLAKRNHVTYTKTYSDQWAESVTRLAGDAVQPDSIEQLLIALRKAQKVTSHDMVKMMARYLREKGHV